MALPENKTPWPPAGQADRYRRIRHYDAWWSGDPRKLAEVYGGTGSGTYTTGGPPTTINPQGNVVTRTIRSIASSFWATPPANGEDDTRRHLPTATDIARLSAELLFSEPLRIVVDGPRHEVDGPPTGAVDDAGKPILAFHAGDPTPDTAAAQRRLDDLLDACDFDALLLEAAEMASALGSVALRVAWDKGAIPDRPTITRVDADAMWADYTWGALDSVTFWRTARIDGDTVYRHLEEHSGGCIYHGLYQGTSDNLGVAVPLSTIPSTAGLMVDQDGALQGFTILPVAGAQAATAVSIPNMLPDSHNRRSRMGASDYTEPVLDLLDAGDQAWSQMMTSMDDAKSRIIISKNLLETQGIGKGLAFNMAQRVFQRVNLPPQEKEGGALPIEKVQFEMRLAEYWAGITSIYNRTLVAAGYSPATTGTDTSLVPRTATEVAADARRSLVTRDKKVRLWQNRLEALLTGLLAVDAAEFQTTILVDGTAIAVQPYPVRVQFPDAVQPTTGDLLDVAATMYEKGLATLETALSYLHPDWDEGRIGQEADALRAVADSQAVIDPITFGLGGRGLPPVPPADEDAPPVG